MRFDFPSAVRSIKRQYILVLFILSMIVSCRSPSPPQPQISSSFLTSSRLPHFVADGRIQLRIQGETYSGNVMISASSTKELRIQIFTPVIGTLLYEIRVNATQFMTLDYQNQIWFLGENNSENRKEWLGVDVTISQFIWILWGRMLKQEFEELKGIFFTPNLGEVRTPTSILSFELSEQGILQTLTIRKSEQKVDVQIRSYQSFFTQFIPKKIVIRETSNQSKLILVLNRPEYNPVLIDPLQFTPPKGMTNAHFSILHDE